MRARWDGPDYISATQGQLRFSREQAALIRAALAPKCPFHVDHPVFVVTAPVDQSPLSSDEPNETPEPPAASRRADGRSLRGPSLRVS
jgi:hypothetical protein